MLRMGNSLAVQWLGLYAFTADSLGSVPAQGMKIPQAAPHGQNYNNNNTENGTSSLKRNKPATRPTF